MKKTLMPAIAIGLLAASGVALATSSHSNNIQVEEKITICHRSNAVDNPYQKISVDLSAVDGEGKNDHSLHTGPVATSEAVAQALKDSKTKWGDIIPNILNWTTEGQGVYNNDCHYVGQENPPTEPPVVDEDPTPDPTDEPTDTPDGGLGGGTPAVTTLPETGGHGSL